MITNKYNYLEIKRTHVNGKRLYKTPTGNLPSVTTILSATKPQADKDGLQKWRDAVGAVKAQEIMTDAANRGTRMHKYLEDYVDTGKFPKPGTLWHAQHANKMAKVIVDNGMQHIDEIWGSEVNLYFPDIYAGTTDLVGVHKGQNAIMDFKQTNKPKTIERVQDYFLQLASYAQSHDELFGTTIRKGVVFMCSKDFEYQEFVIEGVEFDKYRCQWWKRVEQYFEM